MKTVNDTRKRDKACLVEVIPASLWVEHGWMVSIVTEVASGHQSITSYRRFSEQRGVKIRGIRLSPPILPLFPGPHATRTRGPWLGG